MIPPGHEVDTIKKIAERFGVSADTVTGWAVHPQFPPYTGSPRRRQFLRDQVDAWVREHRPALYAGGVDAPAPAPSEGSPHDLLDARQFAEARAARLGSRVVSPATISSYVSRGWVPPPDRRPGDGRSPAVKHNSWLRSTVDAHVAALKGKGNHTSSPRGRKTPAQNQ